MPNYPRQIADALKLNPAHVAAAIALLDEGNTLPFIARYRKEQTGTMSDETLQKAFDLLGRLRALDERRETIVKTITEQGKLTPELRRRSPPPRPSARWRTSTRPTSPSAARGPRSRARRACKAWPT